MNKLQNNSTQINQLFFVVEIKTKYVTLTKVDVFDWVDGGEGLFLDELGPNAIVVGVQALEEMRSDARRRAMTRQEIQIVVVAIISIIIIIIMDCVDRSARCDIATAASSATTICRSEVMSGLNNQARD